MDGRLYVRIVFEQYFRIGRWCVDVFELSFRNGRSKLATLRTYFESMPDMAFDMAVGTRDTFSDTFQVSLSKWALAHRTCPKTLFEMVDASDMFRKHIE